MWALTAFVLPFSFAIAMLKDVPDAEGDRQLPDRHLHGPPRAGTRGAGSASARSSLAYAGMVDRSGRCWSTTSQPVVLAGGHLAALGAAADLRRAASTRPIRAAFTAFYMRVWALFFLEYGLVPAAVLAA